MNESFSYDVRGRLLSANAIKNTTTVYSLGGPGAGNVMTYAPNSGLTGANENVNGNWSYSYDALNRIAGANKAGGTNFTFDVDRNANRWHQNPVGQGAQLGFDTTTNRIASGNNVVYDAAGNIINDGIHSYVYDAEGRITQVDGGTTAIYAYDALGRRARRTVSGTGYEEVYDRLANMIAEVRTSDSVWMRGEVFGLGHLATYSGGGTYFVHTDGLGSERVHSDWNGNSVGTCTGNPYGDNYACTGTNPSPIRYAGMEYDSETQMYHTPFRYYNPRLGVWMTPDPAGLAAIDQGDPQSMNRYAYVGHNPLNYMDPLGLFSDGCVYGCWNEPPCFLYGVDCFGGHDGGGGGEGGDGGGEGGGEGATSKQKQCTIFVQLTGSWISPGAQNEAQKIFAAAGINLQFVPGAGDFSIARVMDHELGHQILHTDHTATGIMRKGADFGTTPYYADLGGAF